MTVRENLDMGAYLRRDKSVSEDLDRVFELFPRLQERERQKAGTMSGGEQQMLAIGRALMARPRLLLLDEPSMGISPILTERIYDTIAEINRQGTTILLVEQNANFALGVSQRGYVLETGKVVAVQRVRGPQGGPRGAEGVPGRMTILADIGAASLWLLYGWLLCSVRRLLPLRAQGLRHQAGAGARDADARDRRRDHAVPAGPRRFGLARAGARRAGQAGRLATLLLLTLAATAQASAGGGSSGFGGGGGGGFSGGGGGGGFSGAAAAADSPAAAVEAAAPGCSSSSRSSSSS